MPETPSVLRMVSTTVLTDLDFRAQASSLFENIRVPAAVVAGGMIKEANE